MQRLLQDVIVLVKDTGDFIREESHKFDHSKIEYKGTNDLVSYVDKEAEMRLVKGLSEILPGSGFIAEEGTSSRRSDSYNWIIDPLDGTTNFAHGLPVYAISVALVKRGELALGVVYELNRDECFHASKGEGAFLNHMPIRVSPVKTLDKSLLATGFPYYDFEKMSSYLSILNEFMQTTHGLRRMGSAAVDLAYTACGRFEGFFEYNLNAWDVAAGALLVQEAGGTVTDFKGGNNFLMGREIVAGNATQQEMLRLIQKHWK
ncbi:MULTISPECIES: inositol monophosphatase family protein [Roseivirga]|jgi:myo-inositol-1(or 4)-monophosphatase|uniref:Inositol-1-monophosphatase n=1 Tax=Roseivirga thermotolerans TaxID=1758176 RepID=A0ABQ3I4B2_9BACT|nr:MULTISPECIES: inositol monophosphatase family protein [Roseivirga]MEC7755130.1 inositol monophosphatase family protein [Bacteroidota bacterium]GHE56041.1 inositol monophosphatase [Roseivirga thermotolerans]|tara:strand:+ start:6299 stop:7081 length:783 start_codon:yes stop_codon:yes gene_type:complete